MWWFIKRELYIIKIEIKFWNFAEALSSIAVFDAIQYNQHDSTATHFQATTLIYFILLIVDLWNIWIELNIECVSLSIIFVGWSEYCQMGNWHHQLIRNMKRLPLL